MSEIFDIAVIGGGAAGMMAAQRAVLNNDRTVVFPGSPKDKKRSRAFWVYHVENMPALFEYKKAIVGTAKETFEFLEQCPFADKFDFRKKLGVTQLSQIEHDGEKFFQLIDNKDGQTLARNVILCTGIMDVQPKIKGSISPILPYANVQVVDYCLRCDGHLTYGKDTVVIGHGQGAAWVAIMLYERYQNPSMTILTHGQKPEFTPETQQLINKYQIKVIQDEITGIVGKAKQKELEAFELASGQSVPAQFAFVSLGMIVYNELAKQIGAELDNRGLVITQPKGQTNIEGLYVAGDLRSQGKNQIYTAWDQAVDCADHINGRLRAAKRNS